MVMRYKIFTLEDGTWQGREDYNSHEKAEDKAKKSYKKKENRIIKLPDNFDVGLKIFSSSDKIFGRLIPKGLDEFLYGVIIREDDLYYYINRSFMPEDDELFFMKCDFETKFVTGMFHIKED